MEKSITQSGPTVDEAVAAALGQLGLEKDQVTVEVLDAGSRGFLGLGQRQATVEVRYRVPKDELAREFLARLLELMGYDSEVEVSGGEQFIQLSVDPENPGALIGRRGQTVNAIQHVSNLIVGRQSEDRRRIIVDVAGYRRKRQRSLEGLARRTASRVGRLRRPARLEPMPAHERKAVHLALKDVPGVRTWSEGEEPFRRVVVAPEQ